MPEGSVNNVQESVEGIKRKTEEIDKKLLEIDQILQNISDVKRSVELLEKNSRNLEEFQLCNEKIQKILENEIYKETLEHKLRELRSKSDLQKRSISITIFFTILGFLLSILVSFFYKGGSQSLSIEIIFGIAVSIACFMLYRQFWRSW